MILHRSCKSMWIHTRNRKGTGKGSRKGSKRPYENTERCISSKNPCKDTAYSYYRWKRHCENTGHCASVAKRIVKTKPIRTTGEKALWKHAEIAYAARIHVKTQPCRKPGKKVLGKTPHFPTSLLLRSFWNPRSMSMSKRSPSVIEPLDDMWWCNKKQKIQKRVRYILNVSYHTVFLHKMLAPHRQPTFRDSRWTKYSNPGQLYPPRPPNFKVVFFFQGLRRVDKTNQTPQHDRSCTCSLTLKFGEGGVVQSFPRGVNILSIYGMQIIVNHFKHDKGFKFKWIQPSFDCSWWVVQHVVLEIVLKDPSALDHLDQHEQFAPRTSTFDATYINLRLNL